MEENIMPVKSVVFYIFWHVNNSRILKVTVIKVMWIYSNETAVASRVKMKFPYNFDDIIKIYIINVVYYIIYELYVYNICIYYMK